MFHSDKIVLQGFARSIIRRKARLIARCGGFNANDQRDIEQELLLRLLQSLPQFDAEQAHINVFITTVVERSMAMLIRERHAKKRDATGIQSLTSPVDDGGPNEPSDHRGSDPERIDLTSDVAEVMASLPAELRDFAERLKLQTVSQVAREMDVPRTTLLRWVDRLRRCFEDAGLRIYL